MHTAAALLPPPPPLTTALWKALWLDLEAVDRDLVA